MIETAPVRPAMSQREHVLASLEKQSETIAENTAPLTLKEREMLKRAMDNLRKALWR